MVTALPIRPGERRSLLVLGGARSGKTRRALTLAAPFAYRTYVATAEALDSEMAERIALHKAERGGGWTTVEVPLALAEALVVRTEAPEDQAVIVVDCLTLWLSNLMHHERDLATATDSLVTAIGASPSSVILVSNEVGLGIVPENALARRFRDAQGRLNQQIAAAVTGVEFVAAGLPLRMK